MILIAVLSICSIVKSIEISSRYILNWRCRYYYCNTMFRNVKVGSFYNILDLLIFTPFNSSRVTMSNKAKFESGTNLKSCSLECCQSYCSWGSFPQFYPQDIKVFDCEILDFQDFRQVMANKFSASPYLCHLRFHHF